MAVYDRLGVGYTRMRRPDRRIAAQIRAALGPAGPVINVGGGTGSYEPVDLTTVAVDPSMTMLTQRPHTAPFAVCGVAEALPFDDAIFASGLAILTVHHWHDIEVGLRELRRVVRGSVVILTWDKAVFDDFWMVSEYVPASRTLDQGLPSPETIAEMIGMATIQTVSVPADCTDGFYGAWWKRPEAYLDTDVRAAISGLARLSPAEVEPGIERLRADIASGEWARRHQELFHLDTYDVGYRLVIGGS